MFPFAGIDDGSPTGDMAENEVKCGEGHADIYAEGGIPLPSLTPRHSKPKRRIHWVLDRKVVMEANTTHS